MQMLDPAHSNTEEKNRREHISDYKKLKKHVDHTQSVLTSASIFEFIFVWFLTHFEYWFEQSLIIDLVGTKELVKRVRQAAKENLELLQNVYH